MRPTKLTIQGLTAYKQQVEVDFSDLDLFAITGPTGAGKSSLVDAITFALFGKAPRVGREVRELISQGENQLKVDLYFSSNGDQYRIHRSTARKGTAKVQFERFDAATNDWHPEEDRTKEANAAVERVIQMDYDAFVRSVLLPQGQFQEFLAGDREQRRKVLDGLLQLNVYAQMLQRANSIDRDKSAQADAHRRRLESDLANATPEVLKAAKAQLKQLKTRAEDLAKLRQATDDASRIAEALSEAQRREQEARGKHAIAAKALAEASELVTKSKLLIAGLDARVAAVADEIAAVSYDHDLHLRLVGCLPLLKQVEDSGRRESKLSADVKTKTSDLEKLRAAEEAVRKQIEVAQLTTTARHDEYETARQANATALLRQGLAKGDPCPVCGQAVPELPKGKPVAQDKLKAAWEKAQAEQSVATERATASQTKVAVAERETKSLEEQIAELRKDRMRVSAELEAALGETGADMASVNKRIETLSSAKEQRESLAGKRDALITERERDLAKIESARTNVIRLDTEVKSHDADAMAAAKDGREAVKALTAAAKQMAWDDVSEALEAEGEVGALLRRRAGDVQTEEREVNQGIGAAAKQIEHTESAIEQAKTLRELEKVYREEASLARDLASLLQANRFPAFLRSRAMTVLAQKGSTRLREISQDRYDLEAKAQDFVVVDRWNGSTQRPVETLSGGETFLASLALALTLAENLTSLDGIGLTKTLDTLFIDEGFSHLDAETLDTVASALEVLGQDRRRLIGVVTHVPALAERMPARITVHKSQGGSTVTVE
ncbi:MAG: SMC family ATPase [Chloroflexota bacterium]